MDNAVCNLVDRLNRGQPVRRELKNGVIVYSPVWVGLLATRIAVLRIAPCTAGVQCDILGAHQALGGLPTITDNLLASMTLLLQRVDTAVMPLLREGVSVEQLDPPVPPADDMIAVFEWHRIYQPTMTDDELARLIHKSKQTVSNERATLGYGRYLFRERLAWEELRRTYPPERFSNAPERRKKRR